MTGDPRAVLAQLGPLVLVATVLVLAALVAAVLACDNRLLAPVLISASLSAIARSSSSSRHFEADVEFDRDSRSTLISSAWRTLSCSILS